MERRCSSIVILSVRWILRHALKRVIRSVGGKAAAAGDALMSLMLELTKVRNFSTFLTHFLWRCCFKKCCLKTLTESWLSTCFRCTDSSVCFSSSPPQWLRPHPLHPWTSCLSTRQLLLRLRLPSRLNIMMRETTGARTVTSPLVPCLIFSRTCTANHTERFVGNLHTRLLTAGSKS